DDLGFDGALGTVCEVRDGVYTGRALRSMHAENKAAAVRELGFDLDECTAYSDSHTDLPLLEAVGTPVAVNPDRRLRAVAAQRGDPPANSRLVVCERTFRTGMLGYYARRLAEGGLVAVLTATSPARLGPPGGPKLAGTNPLAIGIPSSGGDPVVVDVSMGAVT